MATTAIETVQTANSNTLRTLGTVAWLGTMAEATARAYESDLKLFIAWITKRGIDPAAVTAGVMTAYLADLTTAGQAKSTQLRKLAAVRSFYRFASVEGVDVTVPQVHKTPKVHRDPSDIDALETAQARSLWVSTVGQPRARALVAVMMFSGLRISEVASLKLSDLQEQRGERVVRVHGKGDKPRTVVLPAPAVQAITEWLAVRGDQQGPLFCTRTGKAMDVRSLHRLVEKLGQAVGIEGLHPHSLRHTYATQAVDAGVDILKLATSMGHASPTTTMIYIRGRDAIVGTPVHAVAAAIAG